MTCGRSDPPLVPRSGWQGGTAVSTRFKGEFYCGPFPLTGGGLNGVKKAL
jgi:hypothetical protein